MVAADFGSGSGGWAIPLAKILEIGQVFAIDILEEPLSALRSKMTLEKVGNIRPISSNVEDKNGSTLSNSSVDLVLMTNLLFQAGKKKEIFEEAKRILKSDGKILVVDWKEDAPTGPKEGRVSPEEIKKIAEEIGFKVEKPSAKLGAGAPYRNEVSGAGEFEAGIYHYGLVFVKP